VTILYIGKCTPAGYKYLYSYKQYLIWHPAGYMKYKSTRFMKSIALMHCYNIMRSILGSNMKLDCNVPTTQPCCLEYHYQQARDGWDHYDGQRFRNSAPRVSQIGSSWWNRQSPECSGQRNLRSQKKRDIVLSSKTTVADETIQRQPLIAATLILGGKFIGSAEKIIKNSRSILRAAAVLMTRRTRPTRYDTTL
jgi:hypothetical protein